MAELAPRQPISSRAQTTACQRRARASEPHDNCNDIMSASAAGANPLEGGISTAAVDAVWPTIGLAFVESEEGKNLAAMGVELEPSARRAMAHGKMFTGAIAGFAVDQLTGAPVPDLAAAAAAAAPAGPPQLCFGMVADVQYADVADGSSFGGTPRYFRHSLAAAKQAVQCWVGSGVSFAVNIGDLVDGRNADPALAGSGSGGVGGATVQAAVAACHAAFAPLPAAGLEVHHAVGNHEIACWTRQEYGAKSGLLSSAAVAPPLNYYSWTAPAASPAAGAGTLFGGCCAAADGDDGSAPPPAPRRASSWRFVLLDAFDVSVPAPRYAGDDRADHPNAAAAKELLRSYNPANITADGE